MSKIKNGGLDQYGAGPFEQQQFCTAGVERVKRLGPQQCYILESHARTLSIGNWGQGSLRVGGNELSCCVVHFQVISLMF